MVRMTFWCRTTFNTEARGIMSLESKSHALVHDASIGTLVSLARAYDGVCLDSKLPTEQSLRILDDRLWNGRDARPASTVTWIRWSGQPDCAPARVDGLRDRGDHREGR